jgi:hypothetical protein
MNRRDAADAEKGKSTGTTDKDTDKVKNEKKNKKSIRETTNNNKSYPITTTTTNNKNADYSSRRATNGSTRVARWAGM